MKMFKCSEPLSRSASKTHFPRCEEANGKIITLARLKSIVAVRRKGICSCLLCGFATQKALLMNATMILNGFRDTHHSTLHDNSSAQALHVIPLEQSLG